MPSITCKVEWKPIWLGRPQILYGIIIIIMAGFAHRAGLAQMESRCATSRRELVCPSRAKAQRKVH